MTSKNTMCVWYDSAALDAARFYAQTFPDSAVGAVLLAPGDYPDGQQGNVLTVEFTVAGSPCLGLNGSPAFHHTEAIADPDRAAAQRAFAAMMTMQKIDIAAIKTARRG